jgi:multiple sugar transport system ATP-binding protein
MRIVAGIEAPDRGTVSIDGRDVTTMRPAERNVAMVFQNYALYPHLTVLQNIAVPLALRRLSQAQRLPLLGRLLGGGRTRAAIAAEAAETARSLGLDGMLDRRPAQLSGGQRQRVALARAIVRHPAAFLMDEPLSNLDAALRVETRHEIVEIHRRVGAATLYVTHDQAEALTMADRVAVMREGRILQVATPEVIYRDPADLRVATFIGSPRINLLPAALDADGQPRIAAGGRLTLGIRPEDLHPADSGLDCRISHIEFLGESRLLHAVHDATGTALIARLPPSPGPTETAARVTLGSVPQRRLLFDAEGRRMKLPVRAPEAALV